jgi:hypothetical protein
MLVAYVVRPDGTRQLLGFLRTKGEGRAHWEALLNDFYRRGLKGDKLLLVVTDGCPGLAAAIQTVYPRAAHQRCWVHKMRNILEKVRKCDYDAVKVDAQAICLAKGRRQAVAAARAFCRRWPRQTAQSLPNSTSLNRPCGCSLPSMTAPSGSFENALRLISDEGSTLSSPSPFSSPLVTGTVMNDSSCVGQESYGSLPVLNGNLEVLVCVPSLARDAPAKE